ncbi:MAG: glycine cleavage system protein GcvH [Acidobacteriota bacterium]
MYPKDLIYTKEHEWLKKGEDGHYVLGITDFAQKELGEVVFVDLPEVDESFDAGEELGSIESVKAVAEVYTPVAGKVIAVNGELEDQCELVNDDPHGQGWLCKLEVADATIEGAMDADAYTAFIEEGE